MKGRRNACPATLHGGEKDRHQQHQDGERHQPSGEAIPCREGEQVERDRTSEDRIGHAVGWRYDHCSRARVPPQSERRPVFHHGGAGAERDRRRADDRQNTQHRSDRDPDGTAVHDQELVPAMGAKLSWFQRQERPIQGGESDGREDTEDRPLKIEHLPEHILVAERAEPQRVYVIGGDAGASSQQEQQRENQPEPNPIFGAAADQEHRWCRVDRRARASDPPWRTVYSLRRTWIGSTCAARSAGISPAASDSVRRIAADAR